MPFLPTTPEEVLARGWDSLDVILVTGDAYVDHPSYGTAVIARVLENSGYRVGIIAQPDWTSPEGFRRLGRPRLFFGVSAGNLDSMVANYTSHKRRRRRDDYAPGGHAGRRPDRAVIVYANRLREAFPGVTIVLGGIEASLRRFAHYDWWDNRVRRSILFDSKADILVYGMGERQALEIARRRETGQGIEGIRGTAIISREMPEPEGSLKIPSFEDVSSRPADFNRAFRLAWENQDPFRGRTIVQAHGQRFLVQFPPPPPMEPEALDKVFDLPYLRSWHPSYDRDGGVPGYETVRHSVVSHRGCCGDCSFCGLGAHQGRIVQSRTPGSILREVSTLSRRPDFRGTVTDIGGPTANLYGASCPRWSGEGACAERRCLFPKPCRHLRTAFKGLADIYQQARSIPGIKHVFVESGIRYDLLDSPDGAEYLEELCRHHVSGRMKVAPEHSADRVLTLMGKAPFSAYEKFVEQYREINRRLERNQHLVNYFISAHPGSSLEDALDLALWLRARNITPEQIQDYLPLPLTRSAAMYHTGTDPLTGRQVHVPREFRERKMQRALIQHGDPSNRALVEQALRILKREDLIQTLCGREKGRGHAPKKSH